ncbi:MAG: carboxypeptidase-like regulatory domain-containing protein, partial [Bacteroidales bacterium]|nr:carboxypeptidase-like regulatory domain-containing protein [Bacteroidales bacterium]
NGLGAILEAAFQDQDLYYFADPTGYIIITRHHPVQVLTEDFYSNTGDQEAGLENKDMVSGLLIPEEQQDMEGVQVIHINGNGNGGNGDRTSSITLSGRIRELESGEAVIGAVVYVEDTETGVITDAAGYYLLTLSRGTHFIVIRSMGRKEIRYQVEALSSGTLDVFMEEQISKLKGVEIVAENTRNVTRLQLGLDKVDMKTVLELPAAFGETDIIKAALLLPGVQTVGEGASGFNVRGGSTGQNLFLLDAAPVFNSSHLFGFFSAFNPDVINSFSLYKSGIPARYGGRLSSVFDMDMKTGNKKKITASGGISPITGRLIIEGPVIKDKTSFIAGGRTTYSDWILNRVNDPSIRNSDARFYDL